MHLFFFFFTSDVLFGMELDVRDARFTHPRRLSGGCGEQTIKTIIGQRHLITIILLVAIVSAASHGGPPPAPGPQRGATRAPRNAIDDKVILKPDDKWIELHP